MKKVIDLKKLSLKQKIAQMVVVRGEIKGNLEFVRLGIGGIHLSTFLNLGKSKKEYQDLVNDFQKKSKIKLFVTADLEGAWNPFKHIKEFPAFSDIKDKKQAYLVGLGHGKFLKELGVNINFSPVSEFKDKAYGGRVFLGNNKERKEKLKSYIKGLQKNVLGCCKHYPGKGMLINTHKKRDKQIISKKDLDLFKFCFKNKIASVMIGHQIVSGVVDSRGMPSSVSKEVINTVPNDVLVISDAIYMRGLRSFYYFRKRQLYRDLINSGEDVILDFKVRPKSFSKFLSKVEKDVREGLIDEKKIDESVKKILIAKGYEVKG